MKTKAQLDAEIDAYLGKGAQLVRDVGNPLRKTDGRLCLMDPDGESVGPPSKAQVDRYIRTGRVDAEMSPDWSIGIRYTDKNDNDMAIALTPAELRKLIK